MMTKIALESQKMVILLILIKTEKKHNLFGVYPQFKNIEIKIKIFQQKKNT